MNQVTAKQRIGIAAKDHVTISRVHLKLHRGMIVPAVVILCVLGLFIFIVVGMLQPTIDSEWEITGLSEQGAPLWGKICYAVSCQNIETGRTKEFGVGKAQLSALRVEDHIILRDRGWFDFGNNLIRVIPIAERREPEREPAQGVNRSLAIGVCFGLAVVFVLASLAIVALDES